MPRPNSQTFNDGLCAVYSVKNTALAGCMPQEKLLLKGWLRYAKRTVGMNRYTQFLQNDVKVSLILRMPRKIDVSTQDVVITQDGRQYRVQQVQEPQEPMPPCMDVSLERIETEYEPP